MKNLVPAILLLALVAAGCGGKRDQVVSEQKGRVAAAVRIGDDIHEAKTKLTDLGFRIDYGPDFPTKSQTYLMMIVDYGVERTELETLQYAVGMSGGSGESIVGVIKATPDGVITSIE